MRYCIVLIGLLLIAGMGVWLTPEPAVSNYEYEGVLGDRLNNTWSMVAYDPVTGEMGAAGASCVGEYIDDIAALVPGKGVAVTQAYWQVSNRDVTYQDLLDGDSAQTVINNVTVLDNLSQFRQYGALTVDSVGNIETATWTGGQNDFWAGAVEDEMAAVAIQGNILVSADVVNDAYSAFMVESGTLADKMMAGMEAGSAAGGDSRCGSQTALAAFIMVAQPDDPPFAPVGSEVGSADAPTLYLNVLEPDRGANPLISLRDQYDRWVMDNTPTTAVQMKEVVVINSYEPATLGVSVLCLMTLLAIGFRKRSA